MTTDQCVLCGEQVDGPLDALCHKCHQPEVKYTPMLKFAMELLLVKKKVHPGYLADEWSVFKNGRHRPSASRDRFGLTSAAYRCLRELKARGVADCEREEFYFTLIEQ